MLPNISSKSTCYNYYTYLLQLWSQRKLRMRVSQVLRFGTPCRTCVTSKLREMGSQMQMFGTPCRICQTFTLRDGDSQLQRFGTPCRACTACKSREGGSQVHRFGTPCRAHKPQVCKCSLLPKTPKSALGRYVLENETSTKPCLIKSQHGQPGASSWIEHSISWLHELAACNRWLLSWMEALELKINRRSIANDTLCSGSDEFAGFHHTHQSL